LLASSELHSARSSSLILGVWGSDPHPDEGRPALLARRNGGFVVSGSKTYCSGAGGVDLALVMVRTEEGGPPALVLVDPRASTVIDRDWFKGSGLRSSESHLVTFDKTPVIEVLGGPGELSRAPWFARDAIRTAASWAGMADLAALRVLELLERRSDEDVACLAAGRIVSYRTRIDLWLSRAAAIARSELDGPSPEFSVQLRAEISSAARAILDEGARACGSHPFATGDPLDRARRDLDLFLLQHRLDPMVVRMGRTALEESG
jgi:alkylation response protein AidB-like acyl-CoA dehydrogenase